MSDVTDTAIVAPRQSRSRWLWTWLAASVVAILVAFVVGTQVRSPWEAAVSNSRAHPTVTAKVQTRSIFVDAEHVSGTVSLGSTQQVPVRGATDGAAVVTATPLAVGSPVLSGTVLVEVSGRPVLALDLPFPLYRDLAGGASGADVRALQETLKSLGTYKGQVDGRYRQGTATAVAALYKAAGVEPPQAPTAAVAAAKAADDAVAAAEAELASATAVQRPAAEDEAGGTPPQDVVGAATRGLETARRLAQEAHLAALVPLPAAEVVDVPPGAVLVDLLSVGTTVEAGKAVATLRHGSATVSARVGVAEADGYTVGAQVTVSAESDPTISTTGTVTAVGQFQATASADGRPPGYDITVGLADTTGLTDAAKVALTRAEDTSTVEGMAVPLVAVREDGDGTFVLRPVEGTSDEDGGDAAAERIGITITASAEGYAIVAPGELDEGDVVIVATDR